MLTKQQIIAELNADNKIETEDAVTNDVNTENFDDKIASLNNSINNFTEKFTEAISKLHEKYFSNEINAEYVDTDTASNDHP